LAVHAPQQSFLAARPHRPAGSNPRVAVSGCAGPGLVLPGNRTRRRDDRSACEALARIAAQWKFKSTVLLCTDGIPETQNPRGDFLDFEQVRKWLASTDGHSAAQFADYVLGELRQWRGGATFEDDVTLVIARLEAQPSEARRTSVS
jgi:hypothetical protein